MSFGSDEFSGQNTFDSSFPSTNSSGQNVLYFVASGDNGGIVTYPSSSPVTVGVGATNLNMDSNGNRLSETGASISGGGVSAYSPIPTWQTAYGVSGSNKNCPDVSCMGLEPYVYCYYNGGWNQLAGTSLACPLFAATCTIANEQRVAQGKGTLSVNQVLTFLYGSYASTTVKTGIITSSGSIVSKQSVTLGSVSFPGAYSSTIYDITSGTAGSNTCGIGYDLVTGLGSILNTSSISGLLANLTAL
jgi:kumamolisin